MSRLVAMLRQRMRMLRDDAAAVAKVVEEAFQGQSELDDDTIAPHLRQVFYDLQDENILQIRREEYLKDGRQLRGYFWSLDSQERLVGGPVARQRDDVADLYGSLKDTVWERRKPN